MGGALRMLGGGSVLLLVGLFAPLVIVGPELPKRRQPAAGVDPLFGIVAPERCACGPSGGAVGAPLEGLPKLLLPWAWTGTPVCESGAALGGPPNRRQPDPLCDAEVEGGPTRVAGGPATLPRPVTTGACDESWPLLAAGRPSVMGGCCPAR
jgi:hypothetical protein